MKSFVALVAALALFAAASVKSSPPPATPRASCSRQCLTWSASVVYTLETYPVHKVNCSADAIKYFRKRFVPDVSRVMEHQGGPVSKFTKAAKKRKVDECIEGVADNFKELIATNVVSIKVCGPVCKGKAVGTAVARAAETWMGITPLDTHARVITGFSSLSAGTCVNATMDVSGVDGQVEIGRCAATWTGPPGACAVPAASPPPPVVPALSPPPAGGCTQQCLYFAANSVSPDLYSDVTACPEALSYFNGPFLSDLEATMTAQGVDAGLIAEWKQDVKPWTVDVCGAIDREGDFRVCGPHSSRAGGAAVTKALDPAAWKGATALEKHMACSRASRA